MRLISVSFVWALCLLAAGALAFAAAMNGAGGAEAQSNDPDIQLRSRAADAVLGGDPIEISLAIAHSIGREETLETDLIIVAPYDWSIAGEGFAEPCSTGICNGAYRVEPGERRDVEIRITPTDAGEFTVSAKAAWRLEDGSRSGTQQLEFKVSVRDPLCDRRFRRQPRMELLAQHYSAGGFERRLAPRFDCVRHIHCGQYLL